MEKFKRKLIIKQVYYNGEKDDIYEIKFTRNDSGKVSVDVNEIKARNAAGHLMARLSINDLVGFIKITDLVNTARLRGIDIFTDLEDGIFETVLDEWKHICFHRTDVVDLFELSFERDSESENEETAKDKEELSKEDMIIEGIKDINEKLEKIFEFLVIQQTNKKY